MNPRRLDGPAQNRAGEDEEFDDGGRGVFTFGKCPRFSGSNQRGDDTDLRLLAFLVSGAGFVDNEGDGAYVE